MSRLSKLRVVDPVLTELARGYSPQSYYFHHLFPIVTTSKEAGEIPCWSKEHRKEYNTERAIRAQSNKLDPENPEKVAFQMTEHDISYPIDYREEEEDVLGLEQQAAFTVQEIIFRHAEKQAAALARDEVNYPTDNKITLTANDQFSSPGSDPIGVITEAVRRFKKDLGNNYQINLLMGQEVYDAVRFHAQLADKIKYVQKGIVTEDLMRELFDIRTGSVVVADSVDDSGFIWGKDIILAVVPQKAGSIWVPSYGYTLRKKGYPITDKYEAEGGKIKYIRNTDLLDIKILSGSSGYLIKNAVA